MEAKKNSLRAQAELKKKIKDTEYYGSLEAKIKKGRKDFSVSGGKTTTHEQGAFYTKEGVEHGGSLSIINNKKKKGFEGSYYNIHTDTKGHKFGDLDVSNTNTKENKFNGGITKDRKGNIIMKGGYSHSDTNTNKIEYGKFSAEHSTKDFHDTQGSLKITKNNLRAGFTHSQGTEHSVSAQFGDHIKAEGSVGHTQTASGQLTADRHGLAVKGSYENAYNAHAHIQVGNTDIDAKGKASEKTYGSASIKMNNGRFDANAKIGKEYSANGEIKVNGKTVASVDASAKGEASAGLKIDKNKIAAQAGVDAQAKAKVAFGHTEVKFAIKFDFHIGITFDFKTGLHFDIGGGIHAELTIKDTKTGKETKLLSSPGTPTYILYRKRRVGKKNMKKAQKNKILGQACRPSRHRA